MNTSITPTQPFQGLTVGLLSLGQTPRPDLATSVEHFLPGAKILVKGGLDDLSPEDTVTLALDPGTYPLMVLLADRSSLEVDMKRLIPLLAHKVEELYREGADYAVLMCSGGFPAFTANIPVIRPVSLLLAFAETAAPRKRVGIINPIASQQRPAAVHWEQQGFTVHSAFASPFEPEAVCAAAQKLAAQGVECIVLDCMSFTEELRTVVQKNITIPILVPMRMVRTFFQAVL